MARRIVPIVALALGAGALALAIHLGRGPAGPERAGPRAVHLGEEECAECHMIANDASFAAERVLGPDDVKVYDDPGCLLRELAKDRSGAPYFADATTGEWLDAATVRFEKTKRATPMGYGLAAVRADRAPAGSLDLEAAIRRVSGATKEKE